MDFSASREDPNAFEDSFRAVAMARRELVIASCSVRLCVRSASVVADIGAGEVDVEAPLARASLKSSARAVCRGRRVDVGGGAVEIALVVGSGTEGSRGKGGTGGSNIGSGCSIGDVCSSVLTEGVSSPRRSSPSEVSSSDASAN